MKNLIFLLTTIAGISCSRAQNAGVPEWTVTARVVNDEGRPVAGANVKVWYHIQPVDANTVAMTNISGLTDAKGIFVVTRRSGSLEVMCEAEKQGHYSAGQTHEFRNFSAEDPHRLKPIMTLMLKQVRRPTPLYAKSVNLGLPVFGKAAGYDMTVGDWIAPFGNGMSADILFTGEISKEGNASNYRLKVTFPNKGDGIQEFRVPEAERGSALRSPYETPLEGYQPEWVQIDNRKQGQAIETNRDKDRNFFFRTKTVLDDKGEVKSALYGKIYGDFLQFRYYLNPKPNQRNIEFNPSQNLLKNLKSFERVNAP